MKENSNEMNQQNSEGIGFIQKPGMGSHSYTVAETKTMGFLDTEILIKRINGETLELKNNNKTRYFLVEDGTLFKYNTETFLFYQLNLKTMKWDRNQTFASLYYDTYLRYQELLNFEDYYEENNELDLNSGRNL